MVYIIKNITYQWAGASPIFDEIGGNARTFGARVRFGGNGGAKSGTAAAVVRSRSASPASADSEKAHYRRAAGGERERERPDRGADARPRDVPRELPRYLKAGDAARRAANDRERESQRPGDNPPPNRPAAPERDRREAQAEKEPNRRADRDCQEMVRLHSLAPLIRAA